MDEWNQRINSLFAQVQLHNHTAFEQLYQSCQAKLHGILSSMQPSLACDVLQETFIKIWQQPHAFKAHLGHAWAWIVQVARNLMIDKLRQNIRLQQKHQAQSIELGLNSYQLDCPSMQQCLLKLNDQPREAIVLSFIHGFTHGELAEHLITPLGTVKSWIRRGLNDLKICLQGQD